jgi:hypothetical protein
LETQGDTARGPDDYVGKPTHELFSACWSLTRRRRA